MPQLATQRGLVDEVDERPLTVDLDHGQPLAVASLELRITLDVDLFELEPELVPNARDRLAGLLAEMAAGRVEEGDPGYG